MKKLIKLFAIIIILLLAATGISSAREVKRRPSSHHRPSVRRHRPSHHHSSYRQRRHHRRPRHHYRYRSGYRGGVYVQFNTYPQEYYAPVPAPPQPYYYDNYNNSYHYYDRLLPPEPLPQEGLQLSIPAPPPGLGHVCKNQPYNLYPVVKQLQNHVLSYC